MSSQSTSQRSKKRLYIILLLGLSASVALGWAIILFVPPDSPLMHGHVSYVGSSGSCQSLDPGECEIDVKIYNDTASTLTIKQCGGDFNLHGISCKVFDPPHESAVLRPGESHGTNGTIAN